MWGWTFCRSPHRLAHLVLVQVLGCQDIGIGEKTRWQVTFRYDGVEAVLAHQKFGVRLFLDEVGVGERDGQALAREAIQKLNAIVKTIEQDSLKDLARQKVADAQVTLLNQHARLRAAYVHFRAEAESLLAASEAPDTEIGFEEEDDGVPAVLTETYRRYVNLISRSSHLRRAHARVEREVRKRLPGASPASAPEGLFTELMAPLQRSWERQEQGSFAAIAAINAYFSWLEHVLVLALLFTDVDPRNGTLEEHIGDKWGEKFKRVFDVQERDANRALAPVHEIAETYRNTFGHGGFDKQGATIGIHIDGIGAVPARLTDVRRSPHFELYPFGPASFREVTATLDEVDRFLREGPRAIAMRYIEAGLDVPFDGRSRSRIRTAMRNPERFDEWIDDRSGRLHQHGPLTQAPDATAACRPAAKLSLRTVQPKPDSHPARVPDSQPCLFCLQAGREPSIEHVFRAD